MSASATKRPVGILIVALVAALFGLMTIKSGGEVLFTEGEAHDAAGNFVPFVLWFNFCAGFVYLAASAGLFQQKRWAAWLAVALLTATAIVFAALGWHIQGGGLYETRTVGAMTLRTTVWAVIAIVAYRGLLRHSTTTH